MVSVCRREDNVFDLTGIQAELPHSTEDFVLRGIVEQRFEDDGAFATHDRPGIVDLRAEKIEIVRNLSGFCVPCLSRRRSRRGPPCASPCSFGPRDPGPRGHAEPKGKTRPPPTRGLLCPPEEALHPG